MIMSAVVETQSVDVILKRWCQKQQAGECYCGNFQTWYQKFMCSKIRFRHDLALTDSMNRAT